MLSSFMCPLQSYSHIRPLGASDSLMTGHNERGCGKQVCVCDRPAGKVTPFSNSLDTHQLSSSQIYSHMLIRDQCTRFKTSSQKQKHCKFVLAQVCQFLELNYLSIQKFEVGVILKKKTPLLTRAAFI